MSRKSRLDGGGKRAIIEETANKERDEEFSMEVKSLGADRQVGKIKPRS